MQTFLHMQLSSLHLASVKGGKGEKPITLQDLEPRRMLVLVALFAVKLWPNCYLPSTIGVVSNTAELLQQIEQLNTVKQELTTEVIGFSFNSVWRWIQN